MACLLVSFRGTVAFRATAPANPRLHHSVGMPLSDHYGYSCTGCREDRFARAGVLALCVSKIQSPLGAGPLQAGDWTARSESVESLSRSVGAERGGNDKPGSHHSPAGLQPAELPAAGSGIG